MPHYDLIVPCGIHGRRVTSLERVAGRRIGLDPVRRELKRAYAAVFAVGLTTLPEEGAGLLEGLGSVLEPAVGIEADGREQRMESERGVLGWH
jgi:hypothetical protein